MPDSRPFGIDVSRHQGKISWSAIAQHEPRVYFVGIRATISWGYQDNWFPANWRGAGEYGLFRMSYHVIYPKQPALRQMDNFFRTAPEPGEFGMRVLDFELEGDGRDDPHPATRNQQQDTLWKCSEICKQRDGKLPIIYSRAEFVNRQLRSWSSELLNAHYWWLAQYTWSRVREHPGPPTLPAKVLPERVLFQQTADRAKGFGVQSWSLDRDRFLGPLKELLSLVQAHPAPELTLEEKVEKLWTDHYGD